MKGVTGPLNMKQLVEGRGEQGQSVHGLGPHFRYSHQALGHREAAEQGHVKRESVSLKDGSGRRVERGLEQGRMRRATQGC